MQLLEEQITEITQMVFTTVLGLDAVPAEVDGSLAAAAGMLAGAVQITGAFEGTVTVACSSALASHAAAILFDVPDGAATESDTRDALSELINITGGNLKPLVPGPSKLSLPCIADGGSAEDLPAGKLLGKVRFDCMGQPVEVALLESTPV
ncbi:chemotaxis protein CheX [Candidatus Binatia bacterium]|jgi:chemotaxis protein CheX|nr:chemotaxis protein CheX [Candidatus Binatia bacterium]